MKMHSDMTMMKRLLLAGAIFFLAFGNTPMLYAKECSAVFENNKKNILASKSFVTDGYIFATGKMLSKSSNREVGFSKAKLEAVSNIVYFLESKVDWPENISPVLRKRVWREYLKCVPVELSIQKSNIMYRKASGEIRLLRCLRGRKYPRRGQGKRCQFRGGICRPCKGGRVLFYPSFG